MTNLPVEFLSDAKTQNVFDATWEVNSGNYKAVCAIPTEFGGTGGGFSPEDLFLQSAINCFVGTFKVMAKLSKLNYGELEVKGKLLVDKNDDEKIVMKSIHLEILISQVDRPDRTETIVVKAIKEGYILNSLKSQLTYSLKII
jgi:organic hydroperoxide reductase OsmC/OhrA